MAPTLSTETKVLFLSQPGAYPHAPDEVEVVETHMSWVFLAGDRVYKMKKPVRYPFLDFRTLEARAYFVGEEIRLNRRLAPDVYIGPRTLTLEDDGSLALAGAGLVVDWLVEMKRLPRARMLDQAITAGTVSRDDVERVVKRLVAFYGDQVGTNVTPEGHVARLRREQAETVRVLRDPAIAFDGERLSAALDRFLAHLDAVAPLLAERVREGRVIEGHGDLRPDHVCLGEPLAIIDCLEFDRGLRQVDPFDEIAYLGMECARHGAGWVFPLLRARVIAGMSEDPPATLLAFYWRNRALLRARLALLHLTEPNPRQPEKWRPMAWRYVELAEEAEVRVRRT